MSKRKQTAEPTGRAAGKRPAVEEPPDDDLLSGLPESKDGADLLESDLLGDDLAGDEGLAGEDDDVLAALAASDSQYALGGGESEDGQSEAPEEEMNDADVELPMEADTLETAEELDFSEMELSAAQARRVAPLLAGNSNLAKIKFAGHSLSINDLKEEDELEWDSEEFTDVEAIVIAELLKGNTTLKRLDLARNQISDDGAVALANSLRDNTSLEYLNLESNDIAEKGLQAFCSALSGNTTLQYLNLKENSYSAASQQDLRDVWTKERTTVGLHLS